MTVFAIVLFGLSLIAIASLFVLKQWEMDTGRVLAPAMRMQADARALELKQRLFHIRLDLARIPPLVTLYCRYLIHEGALGLAAFARLSERQAHRVADLVSHKRTFVARETRSDFLKKVGKRKNAVEEHS